MGGCGELGPSPSVEAFQTKGRDWSLQAVELETGPGHQRRLWKWACYFASEVGFFASVFLASLKKLNSEYCTVYSVRRGFFVGYAKEDCLLEIQD